MVIWPSFGSYLIKMQLMHDALVYRIKRLKDAIPNNAPILYKSGAFKYKLNASENVEELFKHQRATISMGYIGLYEAATMFYGPDWEDNIEAKTFTLDILREMKYYQNAWTNQYDIWFSIYSTPSESLTDRFCRLDKERLVKYLILPIKDTTRTPSIMMCVKM